MTMWTSLNEAPVLPLPGSTGSPKHFRRDPTVGNRRSALAFSVGLCLGLSAALTAAALLVVSLQPSVAGTLLMRRGVVPVPAAAETSALVDKDVAAGGDIPDRRVVVRTEAGAAAASRAAVLDSSSPASSGAASLSPPTPDAEPEKTVKPVYRTPRQTLAKTETDDEAAPWAANGASEPAARQGDLFRKLMSSRRSSLAAPHPYNASRTLSGGKPHYFVECVLVKHGGDILREHIIRNGLAGVDHFYIFDDNTASAAPAAAGLPQDTDSPPANEGDREEDLREVLSVFDPSIYTLVRSVPRRVTAEPVTDHVQVQRRTYHHCAKVYGPSTTWMAFVDTDEFFETHHPDRFPGGDGKGVAFGEVPFMRLSLARQQAASPAVPVRWSTALTNGQQLPPPDGSSLAAHFPMTCDVQGNPRALRDYKSIVQPATIDFDHWFIATNFLIHGVKDIPLRIVAKNAADDAAAAAAVASVAGKTGPAGEPLPPSTRVEWYEFRHRAPFADVASSAPLEAGADHTILHYWSRDLLSYTRKMARGRPNGGIGKGGPRTLSDLLLRERACTSVARVPSVAARLPVVERYMADLPPLDATVLRWLDDEKSEEGGDGGDAEGMSASTDDKALSAMANQDAKVAALLQALRQRTPLDSTVMCTRYQVCERDAEGRRLVPPPTADAAALDGGERNATAKPGAAVFPYAWVTWYFHPVLQAESAVFVDSPLPPRRFY
ncbi:hypothetical protein MMPV_003834 [Pyropia vietnamensis]